MSKLPRVEGQTIRYVAIAAAVAALISVALGVTVAAAVTATLAAVLTLVDTDRDWAKSAQPSPEPPSPAVAELHALRSRELFGRRADAALLTASSANEVADAVIALAEGLTGGYETRLLLCSPRTWTLGWALPAGGRDATAISPSTCASLRTLNAVVSADSRQMESCDHLDASTAHSSVCVAMPGAGSPIGVLEITGPLGDPPSDDVVDRLELLARRAGQRLAAIGGPATTPEIDPATGLESRSEVLGRLPELLRRHSATSVAIAEIDDWAILDDRDGRPAAAKALRAAAAAIRRTLRPSDAVTRLEGARFLVVLPNCSVEDARRAMERVRERLALDGTADGAHPVTMSIGLAYSENHGDAAALIGAAEVGAGQARACGGNRALISAGG